MADDDSEILDQNLSQLILNNSTVKSALGETVIVSTEDKIRICLMNYLKDLSEKKEWLVPFGLFLSILLTFLTTDFRDTFGISKENWKIIFIIAEISFFVWLCKAGVKAGFAMTVEQVLDKIKKTSMKQAVSSADTRQTNILKIVKATYGTHPDKIRDVTQKLVDKIGDNKLSIYVHNDTLVPGDDPDKGAPKKLFVEYKFNNEVRTKTVAEYLTATLP
jgi:hypothetical protein